MERFTFYAVVLVLLSAEVKPNETLYSLFRTQYGEGNYDLSWKSWMQMLNYTKDNEKRLHKERSSVNKTQWTLEDEFDEILRDFYGKLIHKDIWKRLQNKSKINNISWWNTLREIFHYVLSLQFMIISEFGSAMDKVTLQSLYSDLNCHCDEYLDLTVESRNMTCTTSRLLEMVTLNWKTTIDVAMENMSRGGSQQPLTVCSGSHANCTADYQKRFGKLLSGYIDDLKEIAPFYVVNATKVDIIKQLLDYYLQCVSLSFVMVDRYFNIVGNIISFVPSIEPFTYENLIRGGVNRDIRHVIAKTRKQTTWGIVRSNSGTVDHPCSYYKQSHPPRSEEYKLYVVYCYSVNLFQSLIEIMRCVYNDPNSTPLRWLTFPSVYFDSQCLCLVYNGTDCGVKVPQGVRPKIYCLSVLIRDFQRQVTSRPAVTYLDYAFKSRVPICRLTKLLQLRLKTTCKDYEVKKQIRLVLSLQCYFNGILNKELNCTETPIEDTYNVTVLCGLKNFMSYVICEGDVNGSVRYYEPGDSGLVQTLTYVEAGVRVLTLTTYLACPQLRNLPGKLLIGYQTTALLRLVVVRASLEDLALAVRLDVTFDLASTLWLTAYLHFLTSSIRTLRLPDSLTTAEALVVLLRSGLFGWALPAALSTAFFKMDDALDSRLMVGQLLFVLCNYLALLANVFMFFYNFNIYQDVRSKGLALMRGGRARSVFADLFNFALKTLVLSGAGISFRLVFTQIPGVEHLLSYYHALGTLQALLLFLLYGCNREARELWLHVLSRALRL